MKGTSGTGAAAVAPTDGARPNLPCTATIADVEVVTIPLADYAALLACRDRLAAIEPTPSGTSLPRSPIERDAEVARFLTGRLGTGTIEEARAACVERFGHARTPSASALHRYWQRVRARTRAETAAKEHS